jgi:hypothetical protein
MMIADLGSVISILALGALIIILPFLLHTFLSSRKPIRMGRRIPSDGTSNKQSQTMNEVSLSNIEEDQEFDGSLIKRLAKIIEVLPSLEA